MILALCYSQNFSLKNFIRIFSIYTIRMKLFLIFVLSPGFLLLHGQSPTPEYYSRIKMADSLYRLHDYKNAGIAYSSAFKTLGNKGSVNDRYNAARSWALANVPDSAFDCLERIIKKTFFTDYDRLVNEPDFNSIHNDKRWQPLVDFLKDYRNLNIPEGWVKGGGQNSKYKMGIEEGSGKNGNKAATIKSYDKDVEDFGNLMQSFSAVKYLNKRVRMSGFIKTKDVEKWASFWVRVDQEHSAKSLAFDNMMVGRDRSVKGTTEWTKYEIVLDVPSNADKIVIGFMMGGFGQMWVDDLKFEIVDKSVPLTGKDIKFEPVNLDFEK